MLELNKISKSYTTGDFTQTALRDINIKFRKNEFVCILGQSGSGKTTLLNILSGLDRYDKGDLIINGKSTKKFTDLEWDAYRNNCIGFIFQSYNLINHITILDNVEMGLTLSGVTKSKKREKAIAALDKVGLKDHMHKKPNQLSGGQMQRVAIARALANDPDIILADEPTGALDSKTSVQIMDLIKEIAKDKLVIMVTHNADLANEYASRIIELSDGNIINDSNPIKDYKNDKKYSIKKTAMSFATALSLSFNNIKTKLGRTILTAFACSIGIIGISLILSLSNGFDRQIDIFEADTLSSLPIVISQASIEVNPDDMKSRTEEIIENENKENKTFIVPYDVEANTMLHYNKLSTDYVDYIEKIDGNLLIGLSYMRATNLNLITEINDIVMPVNSSTMNLQTLTVEMEENNNEYLKTNYDLLYGNYPNEKEDLLLMLDSQNRIDKRILQTLGIDTSVQEIEFTELMNKEIKVVMNDDYYKNLGNYFTINTDFNSMNASENTITLKIVGIVKNKSDNKLNQMQELMGISGTGGLFYTNALMNYVIEQNQDSEIVLAQKDSNYNILTGELFENDDTKEQILLYLGAKDVPMSIFIYPRDFDSKEQLLAYLDEYNNDLEDADKIVYNDMAASIVSMSSDIMDAITYVLIAFSAVSLVVSAIMIGIITYISVLERTKEIGILRSLGARKKDVTRVFNAETFLIGLGSGLLGVLIARLMIFPINIILKDLTNLDNVAKMAVEHAILMIVISIIITFIGGFLPARMAAKKDPVEALRTE